MEPSSLPPTTVLYQNLFEQLDVVADLSPGSVLMDFEAAMRKAVLSVWPSTTIRGCYFHFCQALWMNFQKYDLVPEYQVPGSAVRSAFKSIKALPFVPLDDLDLAWRLLKPTIPSDMDEFVAYFESTWMGTSAKAATFDPWSWNHHDSVLCGLPRSSNIAEGWHNGFQSLISCANPTMWKFLDCLKLEQAISDTKISRHLNRDPPPRRQAKWIRWDERVDKVVNDYDTYADVMQFLKVVAAMT